MSPLIDCVFILLIFFIVTTTFVEETGVEVDKPQAAASTNLDKNSILFALTEKGQVVYANEAIGMTAVRSLVKRLTYGDDEMPVIIQADQAADSGLLVRLVGECKAGGAKKVSIATES